MSLCKLLEKPRPATVVETGIGIDEGFALGDLSAKRTSRKCGQVLVDNCQWIRFRISRQSSEIKDGTCVRVTLDRAMRCFFSSTTLAKVFEGEATGGSVGLEMVVALSVATSSG